MRGIALFVMLSVVALVAVACKSETPKATNPAPVQAEQKKEAPKAEIVAVEEHEHGHGAEPGSYEDWCGEHQVPESQCTRCNSKLIAAFKASGDWCAEHGLPESQCLICNPNLKIVRPPKNGERKDEAPKAEVASADDHAHGHGEPGTYEDWCGGHGVPESQCTRCNGKLIAAFKASGDWCAEHGLPESQCLLCNPNLKIVRPTQIPGK